MAEVLEHPRRREAIVRDLRHRLNDAVAVVLRDLRAADALPTLGEIRDAMAGEAEDWAMLARGEVPPDA